MCDLVQRIKSVRADLANDQVNGFERLSIIDDPERSLRDQVMTLSGGFSSTPEDPFTHADLLQLSQFFTKFLP